MECLYYIGMSFDGKRALFVRLSDKSRTIFCSDIYEVFYRRLMDYSGIRSKLFYIAPRNLYRWSDDC
jgi:hypothetical protein